jgi:hypothetical protein
MRVPRLIGRLVAGQAGVVMMTEVRGAFNAKGSCGLQRLWPLGVAQSANVVVEREHLGVTLTREGAE